MHINNDSVVQKRLSDLFKHITVIKVACWWLSIAFCFDFKHKIYPDSFINRSLRQECGGMALECYEGHLILY